MASPTPQSVTVFLDANVLYPAGLRDLLMRLAAYGLFRARWSNLVHEEWIEAVLRDFPDITRSQLERTRRLMDQHVMDSLVTGFEDRIDALQLPDPDDRHVLAAAIHCNASILLTRNLKDFPESTLKPYGIVAQSPDAFIHSLLVAGPDDVIAVARQHRTSLKNPPKSVDEYLDSLEQQGVNQSVSALRAYAEHL
ncbi:MAG: PIN domain-containing protein [Chloroflexota bacterium]